MNSEDKGAAHPDPLAAGRYFRAPVPPHRVAWVRRIVDMKNECVVLGAGMIAVWIVLCVGIVARNLGLVIACGISFLVDVVLYIRAGRRFIRELEGQR